MDTRERLEKDLDPRRERDACGVGFTAHPSSSSNEVLKVALRALARLQHRGAASSDRSGDGAGVLTRIPERLLRRSAAEAGFALGPEPFAVGSFFVPRLPEREARSLALLREVFASEGVPLLGLRSVPVVKEHLGELARAARPAVWHAILGRPEGADDDEWERTLSLAGRVAARRASEERLAGFATVSISHRTLVYKALLGGPELPAFYPDLRDPAFETSLAVFHQRYSTNTAASWPLAQPFHLLAHNGEINTLWGNRNAMHAREPELASPLWGARVERLKPVLTPGLSDSASLDEAMELLVRSGRDPLHALSMLIHAVPDPSDPEELRAFREFHAAILEPWDGPAALAFSDGVVTGAAVDRNGLRPCRYQIAAGGIGVAASEAGIAGLEPESIVESGRVGAGEMLVVDSRSGETLRGTAARLRVARQRPWATRLARQNPHLVSVPVPPPDPGEDLHRLQVAFGYGTEDLKLVIDAAAAGQEPIFSMGDDTPLRPLAKTAPPVYAFFQQRFAQVTNPPLDSLREPRVLSLAMDLGRGGSLLLADPDTHYLSIAHPILLEDEMEGVRRAPGFAVAELAMTWDAERGDLPSALDALAEDAVAAVRNGAELLVLSDRSAGRERAPLPAALALGAARRRLLEEGLRYRVGIAVETGDAWDVHHFVVLFGYGAEAVHPWLALASVRARAAEPEAAVAAFRAVCEKGLLKVLSKMGMSTLSSYCGGQVFDALGLAPEVMEKCFPGTVSPLSGLGFAELAEDVRARRRDAFGDEASVPDHGRVRYRKDTETHAWTPPVVRSLQDAAKNTGGSAWDDFRRHTEEGAPVTPRDLLTFAPRDPVPLERVESADHIRRRFISSAMSLGSISPEAHATLAAGMNRMGARSNSGEGGEDPETWRDEGGDRLDGKIKQVASGRFGVTTAYLVRADEIEIKMAQGSKPGEGGQLPAHKNTELVARLRHSAPGIALISPPPHHDIYSIEDLAQLIHDLKEVNPKARVGVKLVAEAGVGNVAAGCAKAYADYVLISGGSGGTGASPLSSIKNAGAPFELGLAETQAVLIESGFRDRIEVRTDGGLRTARDVVIAACLGAEAFGFGTAALVSIGCAMARQCHLNTCPTGIATQREDLRKKFKGTPEQVVAYFTRLAEDVRALLARLGVRSLDEIVGRNDLLAPAPLEHPRAHLLDVSALLAPNLQAPRRRLKPRNDRPRVGPQFPSLDERILRDVERTLEEGRAYSGIFEIANHHLSVGAHLAGALTKRFGRLPARVHLRFRGPAGQSFGAFAVDRMLLELEGEANDYVGKGLSGGDISIRPYRRAPASGLRTVAGNTLLYGATSGALFAAGGVGDRFAVRNSGAIAVVEGVGAHGCEYMTGGTVVVLGPVGPNFGAAMTGGRAFVLDESEELDARLNGDTACTAPLDDADEATLHALVTEHVRRTASPRGAALLDAWGSAFRRFRKIVPKGSTTTLAVEEKKASGSPGS
jgi:glutamate synthase domain-containing protein 2/glutamate synthase domain-containing protein 1/glutamate synthase domain-containing protein 3